MLINLLQDTVNLNVLYNLGYFLVILLPIALVLLIARFRGFLASIFFLPFIYGVVYFALSYNQVTDMLSKIGEFGTGVIEGAAINTSFFLAGHQIIIDLITHAIKNDTVTKVLNETWFAFVPYLVLFVIFFVAFKKRKRRKEEDYF